MLNKDFKVLKRELKKMNTLSRNQVLLPWMVGKSFLVSNGKTFNRLEVVELRLYKKAGEFVSTRKSPAHKKKRR